MLHLSQLIESLDDAQLRGGADVVVRGIAYDSRQVAPGDVFVPWRGGRQFGDGHRFIGRAIEQGAVAVVAEPDADFDLDAAAALVPVVLVPDSRHALARASARFYGYPSSSLRLIGVTGTNGKTTTSHLIRVLLEAHGHTTGLLGTIHNVIGKREIPTERTTPQSLDIQALLAEMVRQDCWAAVMEVASIALVQDRVTGCEFDVGVFTNLAPEHLDDHGSWDNYTAAKRRLFQMLGSGPVGARPEKSGPKYAVINADDAQSANMRTACRVPVITYGIEAPADYQANNIRIGVRGTSFELQTPSGTWPVEVPLVGRFNVYNALAALAVSAGEGVPHEAAVQMLGRAEPIPGRFQLIEGPQDFLVIVDYAHTPDSLENILLGAREFTDGRLIVVFGCGGDRDEGKRPRMGLVAARDADYVIVTSDNPRSEDPESIIDQVERGIADSPFSARPRELITDRKEAIQRAITVAGPGDTVIIAGKGHETTQVYRDKVLPFDDRLVAAEALGFSQVRGRG